MKNTIFGALASVLLSSFAANAQCTAAGISFSGTGFGSSTFSSTGSIQYVGAAAGGTVLRIRGRVGVANVATTVDIALNGFTVSGSYGSLDALNGEIASLSVVNNEMFIQGTGGSAKLTFSGNFTFNGTARSAVNTILVTSNNGNTGLAYGASSALPGTQLTPAMLSCGTQAAQNLLPILPARPTVDITGQGLGGTLQNALSNVAISYVGATANGAQLEIKGNSASGPFTRLINLVGFTATGSWGVSTGGTMKLTSISLGGKTLSLSGTGAPGASIQFIGDVSFRRVGAAQISLSGASINAIYPFTSAAWPELDFGAVLSNGTFTGAGFELLRTRLTGTAENDELFGDEGPNVMTGLAGDDTYYFDNAGDRADELVEGGNDTIISTDSVDLAQPSNPMSNVENVTLLGAANLAITGNALNNVLTGNSGSNVLSAGAGDDTISGATGNDTMAGGEGFDTATFTGNRSAYAIAHVANAVGAPAGTVTLSVAGPDGTDTVSGVEVLRFADSTTVVVNTSQGFVDHFDGLLYIASYSDLAAALGLNADLGLRHYVAVGYTEGRRITFNALHYIASYPDLIAAFGTDELIAITHFIVQGRNEGRRIRFDGLDYLCSNTDLYPAIAVTARAGALHYIQTGFAQGRTVTFDVLGYGASYTDLMNAYGADRVALATHWLTIGKAQGRTVTFDAMSYIASYPDLMNTLSDDIELGTEHYLVAGRFEGRQVLFEPLPYIASYPDLIAVIGTNKKEGARHYILAGRFEGRHTMFNPYQYLAGNPTVLAQFGSDRMAATAEYITVGYAAGRRANWDGYKYTAAYPDLIAAFGINEALAFEHYVLAGRFEGRTARFNAAQYLLNYVDLRNAFDTNEHIAAQHFIEAGHLEGRTDQPL